MAENSPRTARQVIDQAIRENKVGERLLYGIAVVCVLAGVFALVYGSAKGQGVTALAGAVASALFWPAMRESKQIRRENISIRLMEVPLSKAETADEAAKALHNFFVSANIGGNNAMIGKASKEEVPGGAS